MPVKGTLTANGKARLRPLLYIMQPARSTASFAPAMTTWPGELKFTAVLPHLARLVYMH